MEYVRTVDFAAFPAGERGEQRLVGREYGAQGCNIRCIQVPLGGGSPAGRHSHVFEQIYYIISGTMDLEIAGEQLTAGPGSTVFIPAGVPHRNWNGGTNVVVHLALMVPEPEPGQPISQPA